MSRLQERKLLVPFLSAILAASTLAAGAAGVLAGSSSRNVFYGSPGTTSPGSLTFTTAFAGGATATDVIFRNNGPQTINHIRLSGGAQVPTTVNPGSPPPSGPSLPATCTTWPCIRARFHPLLRVARSRTRAAGRVRRFRLQRRTVGSRQVRAVQTRRERADRGCRSQPLACRPVQRRDHPEPAPILTWPSRPDRSAAACGLRRRGELLPRRPEGEPGERRHGNELPNAEGFDQGPLV